MLEVIEVKPELRFVQSTHLQSTHLQRAFGKNKVEQLDFWVAKTILAPCAAACSELK